MKPLSTLILLLLLLIHPLAGNGVSRAANHQQVKSSATEEIPGVAFCELVKNPKLYFEKQVRLTATLTQATEGQYLSDDECVLSHDEQIGVGYVETDEKQRDLRNSETRKIQSTEYGGRALVTVIGVLRNKSRRDFQWYHYRFDIIRFENVSHVVVPYEGELQAGITYQATVRGEQEEGLSLVPSLRMLEHYAVRIEWTNLDEFPALKKMRPGSAVQRIVFSVISDQIKQVDERRWNRTLQCKIIRMEMQS